MIHMVIRNPKHLRRQEDETSSGSAEPGQIEITGRVAHWLLRGDETIIQRSYHHYQLPLLPLARIQALGNWELASQLGLSMLGPEILDHGLRYSPSLIRRRPENGGHNSFATPHETNVSGDSQPSTIAMCTVPHEGCI